MRAYADVLKIYRIVSQARSYARQNSNRNENVLTPGRGILMKTAADRVGQDVFLLRIFKRRVLERTQP